MKRREFLRRAGLAAAGPFLAAARAEKPPAAAGGQRPNILFITADDLNCDSVGVFGSKVPGTTPNIDRLARAGLRFHYAHVQVANCMPSRNVMQSGLYPHTSGVEGFYQVHHDRPLLPGVLKEHGYFVGIKNKVGHSTPYSPWPWDLVEQKTPPPTPERAPKGFYDFTARAIAAARKAGKPFYIVVNVNDPHKPFFGERKTGGADARPSRLFSESEVVVPPFLPDLPEVRAELKRYYDSVRRADDSVGAVLKALDDAGQAGNTVVMFLSDHGMPFPFAKTNIYHHSTRTPWIVRWDGKVRPDTVDTEHMISAIDFMPTILEIVGIDPPPGLQGRSFLPVLLGRRQSGREYVIKEYNENAGGGRHPMRGVETKQLLYLFNPWADGTRRFRTATQGTDTYKAMVRAAKTDTKIAARLKLFDYRTVEELYDVRADPDALHNLIDDPKYAPQLERLRRILEEWMVRTKDPWLEGFRKRDDAEFRERYMKQLEAASAERRRKRRAGRGGQKRKAPGPARRRKGLIFLSAPRSVPAGGVATVTVRHRLPADLGSQQLHVTIKDGQGKRIERKVLTIAGEGSQTVTFAVPAAPAGGAVSFAAFVGPEFARSLEHVVTAAVPVR